ncbi:MAG: hypothetical protein M3Q42_03015 [Pseudomonadota bacterium]|nr:hypothetical protein [Pseudomonadota bacterium]
MSKLHQPHGRADADTDKGELRKPDDYSNQPGQGGAYTAGETGEHEEGSSPARKPDGMPPEVGESAREYGHASGDRNTRKDEKDWHGFEGGKQRDATPGAPGGAKAQGDTRDAPPGGSQAS